MDDLIHWAMPKLESRTEIEVNCAPVHIVKFKKIFLVSMGSSNLRYTLTLLA